MKKGLRAFMEEGPYGHVLDMLAEVLEVSNHSASTVEGYLRGARHVTYALEHGKLSRKDLTVTRLRRFAREHPAECGCPHPQRKRQANFFSAMTPLVAVLQRLKIAPPEEAPPFEEQLTPFRRYETEERGVADDTVDMDVLALRRLLAGVMKGARFRPERMTTKAINSYLIGLVEKGARSQVRREGDACRRFCKFLKANGTEVPVQLASVVRQKLVWQGPSKKALSLSQLRLLMRPLREPTSVARRDFAVLMVLGRTGLRRSDVSRLDLDSFQARSGTLLIGRTKSRRGTAVPLPDDARDAVLEYVRRWRPSSKSRALFLSEGFPYGQRIAPAAVSGVVARAFKRSGIEHPSKGAHVLRHTLATHLVAAKSPLKAIADILNHASLDTVKRYAAVDRERLKSVVQPWPGGKMGG